MKQSEQCQFIQMVSQTMVFIARRFLIFTALQFFVITRYYASLYLAKNKNQRNIQKTCRLFLFCIGCLE